MKRKKKRQFQDLIERFRGDGCVPACPHFGDCGGCLFQDIAYEDQLLLKREYLNTTLGAIASVERVHPSSPYGYRNRMDMVTAFGKAGLRQAGNYRTVVDVQSCAIMQERSNDLFREVRQHLSSVEDYDYLAHRGYLRYVVVRQGFYTGQVMVNFVVSRPQNRLDELLEGLRGRVDSVALLLQGGIADVSMGEIFKQCWGGTIEERLDDTRFSIGPNSFFQSNSPMALEMYRRIRAAVSGRVLDLYSGVGSISLFVAPAVESVTGVELMPEAVDAAERNRAMNGIENVSFACADARQYIMENRGAFDTLIMDPPRSGMHPKMVKLINEFPVERIVYMSCNPATFRDDMAGLPAFRVESFEAFDMFPQTPHIETLAVLRRVAG